MAMEEIEEKMSPDIGKSASTPIGVLHMSRPGSEENMYSLFDEKGEQISFMAGSTEQASQDFDAVVEALRQGKWKTLEEAKAEIPIFVANLHGGIAEK